MSWHVEDRILRNTGTEKKQGVDLVTDEKFWNFEAYYEYRVPKGNNSGFYLRGRYEIQIFDSFGKPAEAQGNGSIYGVQSPIQEREPRSTISGRASTPVSSGIR